MRKTLDSIIHWDPPASSRRRADAGARFQENGNE